MRFKHSDYASIDSGTTGTNGITIDNINYSRESTTVPYQDPKNLDTNISLESKIIEEISDKVYDRIMNKIKGNDIETKKSDRKASDYLFDYETIGQEFFNIILICKRFKNESNNIFYHAILDNARDFSNSSRYINKELNENDLDYFDLGHYMLEHIVKFYAATENTMDMYKELDSLFTDAYKNSDFNSKDISNNELYKINAFESIKYALINCIRKRFSMLKDDQIPVKGNINDYIIKGNKWCKQSTLDEYKNKYGVKLLNNINIYNPNSTTDIKKISNGRIGICPLCHNHNPLIIISNADSEIYLCDKCISKIINSYKDNT